MPGVDRYLLFMGQKREKLAGVLRKELNWQLTEQFLKEHYPENSFKDKLKYLMYLDVSTWLADESLMRSDKMTMAFGLEERVPILDHHLTELAFQIPSRYKVRGRKQNKWIFREAMKEYLPAHLLGEKKRGWQSPASKWLRADLKDLAYDVLSADYCPATEQYFDFAKIREILDQHIKGEKYGLDIIWPLLTFQIWYKTFIKQ